MKPRRLALYALALLLPLAMRLAMPVSPEAHTLLILFMFPIIVSALLGGLGPGLLATAAAGACAAGHDLTQWSMLLANGVLVSLMSHALSLTRRREAAAKEEQRQSEAGFRAIFEQASVGIAQVAENGRFLRVNGKFCEIVGYRQDELLARTFMDITHPDDLPGDLEQVRRLHAGEIPSFTREKRFLRKDGSPVWTRIHITAVRQPDGTPDYRIGVIEDIALQKATHEALRERERRLAAIIGFSPSALSLKTPDGRYALANPNLQRIHHCDEAGIVGKTDFELYPDAVAQAFRANDLRVLETRARHSVEEAVPVDGEMRAYLSHMFPVTDEQGGVEFICRISLDITDRKRAEAAQKASMAQQEQSRRATLNLLEDAQLAQARAEAALKSLQESEGRFRALVEQSLAGIYIIQDGRLRYVNPGFAAMFGYGSADALIEQVPFSELVMPEDRAQVEENIRQRVQDETSDIHYTFAGQRRDGSRIEVEVHGRRFDYQGRPAVIGLILDITARKAAEDSLRASELRFHDIVNASADWVWEVDAQGRYTYVSESVRDLLGYGPEELLGRTPFDLIPPENAAQAAAEFAAFAARKAPFRDLENVNRRRDGSLIHVATNGMPILDAAGRLLGYRGLDRDITEHRRAQAALAEREARYRAVIESTPDGFWMVDAQGHILASNEAYVRLSGYSLEELKNLRVSDIEASESRDEVRAHTEQILRDGSAVFEGRHRAKDGRIWPVEVAVSYWPEGGYMFAFLRDITGRKTAETALANLNRRMRTLIDTIPDLVWLKDADGVFLACNTRCEALFGIPETEIIGKTDYDFVPRELADFFRASDQAAMEAGRPTLEGETEIRFASDGHRETVQTIKAPFYDEEGTLIGVLGIARDITAMKASETALRARERYIRALFDNFPFMVWLKDREGRFLAANRKLAQVAGASSAEAVLGKTDRDFWPSDMAEHFIADDRAVLASGRPKTVEEEITEAGRRFWLETFKSPVELDGQVIGTVGFARDISERKAAEAEIQARNEELERFNRATVGRELDMLEMKQTINALSRELGRAPPYPLAFLEQAPEERH